MTLEGSASAVMRQLRVLEELVKARLEVDVPGLHAGVRARLESRLDLAPLPIDGDLADKAGPFGWGRIQTVAWEAPRCRKLVLSHIAFRPMIEGLALVVLPATDVDAPIFGADLMALPTRVVVNADVYGTPERTRPVLAELGETFARLGAGPGPAWSRALASDLGLHTRISPRLVDDAFAALSSALGRALDAIEAASQGSDANGRIDRAPVQRAFFDAFHAHGPRTGPLRYLMGADWSERYSRLVFG